MDLFDGRDYMASNNEDNEIDLETINSEIPPAQFNPQEEAARFTVPKILISRNTNTDKI